MKKLLSLILILILSYTASTQTPLTEAVDFTVTTTAGEEITLFDLLDAGNIVFLDFFSTTCGGCNQWAPEFPAAYEYFGCNTGNVFFLGIERFHDDAATIAFDELHGIEFPSASGTEGGGSDVFSLYQVQATPTLFIVNPDRSIPEGQIWNPYTETLITKIENEGGLQKDCETGINDRFSIAEEVKIYPNPSFGETNVSFYLNEPGKIEMEVLELTGQVVKQISYGKKEIGQHALNVPLTNISKGFYLLAIKKNGILIRIDRITLN